MDKTSPGLRIHRALLHLALKASGKTMDPAKKGLGVIIHTGKAETTAPTDFHDEHGEWWDKAERLAIAMEQAASTVGPKKPAQKTTGELLKVIRDYEGRDPGYVAFVEDCSDALVRKVRMIAGLVPADGSRPPKPLTTRSLPDEDSAGHLPSGAHCNVRYIGSIAAPGEAPSDV